MATHQVVLVLAPIRCTLLWLACTETELARGHEVRPLVDLLSLAERTREDEAAYRITFIRISVSIAIHH
jgi:hypothetical protein